MATPPQSADDASSSNDDITHQDPNVVLTQSDLNALASREERKTRKRNIKEVQDVLSQVFELVGKAQDKVANAPIGSTGTLLKNARHFLDSAKNEYQEWRELGMCAPPGQVRRFPGWRCSVCRTDKTTSRRRMVNGKPTLCMACYRHEHYCAVKKRYADESARAKADREARARLEEYEKSIGVRKRMNIKAVLM